MKLFGAAANIHLCVFVIVLSYSIPGIDGTLKSKKILYGLAIAHVLGLLKTQHTTHHVPILIPPKKSCYPKCHKDYHFHEHLNMMGSYDDHDSYSSMDGYDDDFGGDDIYSDEMSSASYVIPKKKKIKMPIKYKKIHHYVDDTSIEDDYGSSISAKSSAGSKYIDSDDPTIDEEVVEEEYIDDAEYESESMALKPKKKKGWKRYLKKLKLKPKRSLPKPRPDMYSNYDDDSVPYDDVAEDVNLERETKSEIKIATHKSQTSKSPFQAVTQDMPSRHPAMLTLPNQSQLPSSLARLNISGDFNQLDNELDDITVDKMFSELVKNNPNNKVLEAIQKELESPVRSFLRNTKIAKLIKKRSKPSEGQTSPGMPVPSVSPAVTTTIAPQTIDQKLLSEAFQGLPVTTPPPQLPAGQVLPPHTQHPAVLYGQPLMMPVNPMFHQPHPSAFQMVHQQPALQQQQQPAHPSVHQYPTHHSMQPYSQLPAPDHYLPEESRNMLFKLVPGHPIMVSHTPNGEIIADQPLMPISESVNKAPPSMPKVSKATKSN